MNAINPKKSDILITGFPFVSHVDQTKRPQIKLCDIVASIEHDDNIRSNGIYKLMGYQFDIRQYLNLYVYKQYGNWHQSYAINRTGLKSQTYGKIDHILDYK